MVSHEHAQKLWQGLFKYDQFYLDLLEGEKGYIVFIYKYIY